MKNSLDHIDRQILSQLSQNAQMPYTEVAKNIAISPGTVHLRIRKLKELQIIKGTTLCLDYAHMGWKLTVFMGIHLKKAKDLEDTILALTQIPEIVKIHHTTGKYDLFVKVHARDTTHYRAILQEEISCIKGVKKTEAFISMEENLNRHILFTD